METHTKIDDYPDLMNVHQVADLLSMDRKTVYRLAKAGKIPCIMVGNNYRFTLRAIKAFLGLGSEPSVIEVVEDPKPIEGGVKLIQGTEEK
jgi:excisionase family DNA binding protein